MVLCCNKLRLPEICVHPQRSVLMRNQIRYAWVAWTLVVWTQLASLNQHNGTTHCSRVVPLSSRATCGRPSVSPSASSPDCFVVDTGCTYSIFDLALRPYLGLPLGGVPGTAPTGAVELKLYRPPDGRVGSLAFTRSPVACWDLSSCSAKGLGPTYRASSEWIS